RRLGAPCVRIPARTAAARGSDLEEAGDRSVFEHFVHGPGDERGDREHGELVEDLVLAQRQGVGDDDLFGHGVRQAFDRGSGEHGVGRHNYDALRSGGHAGVGRLDDGPAGVDHVVDEYTGPALDLTDDAVGLARIGPGDVAGLVDEGQRNPAQRIRPVLGDLDAAGIGRDHGEIAGILVLDVAGEDRHRDEVVDRTVEVPLDLRGVEINGDDPVGTGGLVQVGDEASGDGLASAVLLVLPCVREEGSDDGDPLGRGALEGVDHDQLLHQPLVDRRAVRLEDEDVAAADRLGVPDVDLPVGEVVDIGGEELRPQILRDLFGEFGVRPTADQDELLITRRRY